MVFYAIIILGFAQNDFDLFQLISEAENKRQYLQEIYRV